MQRKRPHLKWQRLPGHRNMKGRAGHTATLVGKRIFVLGGRNGNEFFNDLWAFDTEIEQWKLLQQKAPFSPRAYHTTTLVGEDHLWVIGGSDHSTMYDDIHVLDTVSLKWSSPKTLGPVASKRRGTHAAVLHPVQSNSILIYGGYGGVESCWMNDLVLLHTDTLEWEELQPEGPRPCGRGYHTFTVFGSWIALFGGKGEGGILKDDNLSIYDAVANRWITPKIRGDAPIPRSNHAATLLEEKTIIIHGGRNGSLRLNDVFVLQGPWASVDVLNVTIRWLLIEKTKSVPIPKKVAGKRGLDTYKAIFPTGRSAHALVLMSRSLYVIGGYGGQGLTFNDIFVLPRFPRFPELEETNQKRVELAHGQILIEVAEETDEETEEGWRCTKRIKHPSSNYVGCLPESAGLANTMMQQTEKASVARNNVQEVSDTRSTELMPEVYPESNAHLEKRTISSLEDRSLAMLARENGLYHKEVSSLQQALDSSKEALKEKTLLETDLRRRILQLEEEVDRLQGAKQDLHQVVEVLERKITQGNQRIQSLEREADSVLANAQILSEEVKKKERERHELMQNARSNEQKTEGLAKSLEEMRSLASKVGQERDEYRSCVQKLETELQKQMQALQHANSRYEAEKTFLLKEIAERKETADRLFTELGVSKESSRALEETLKHQAKQLEQEAARVDSFRKEKEDLSRINAVIATESKQLAVAREVAEANCELVRSELQAAQSFIDQHRAEIARLKEAAEHTKDHVSSLHVSLKKNEETFQAQLGENERLRALIREVEEFEQAQARCLQSHSEKLRCSRQSCPY